MGNVSHLKALLRKNWLIWRRNYIGLFLEIIVPVVCAVLFLVFRYAEPLAHLPEKTYSKNPFVFRDLTYLSSYMKNCNAEKNGGKIALAPLDDEIILKLKPVFENYGEVELFQDNQAIDDFTQLRDYGSMDRRLCLAVVMEKNNIDNKYQYIMRYNTSLLPNKEDIPLTTNERTNLVNQENMVTLQKYVTSGFLAIQTWIDNLILQQETSSSARITASIASAKVPAYTKDYLLSILNGVVQYLVVVPLLLPFLRLMDGILREKEKRILEGMKIMGLRTETFYLSWFIMYSGIMTFVSLLTTTIIKFGFFYNSSFLWIFLWYWEYSICLVSLCILISVFFNKAKIGSIAGFVFIFLLQWVGQLFANDDVSPTARFWASIAPPISIALSGNQILTLEASQVGLTTETVSGLFYRYRTYYHYIWMAVDTIVFLILALYLDQVLPSEFGIRKHPLFCLKRKRKLSEICPKLDTEEDFNVQQNNDNFEEVDPVLKTQDRNGESILINNLRKKYNSGKVAVDGVSYRMYAGQIFALLGHNGAGKTTTISMLTGLYPATEGSISIFGMDIHNQLEEIRKVMGVCPQHDVLFDDLTVKEHLYLFATFKGVNTSSIKEEVDKLIIDLDLHEKRNYRSKNLSGGQKRRLSVAISFIGGSKFILLDEPSSGMDTSARRRLWDMLKNYKHGRVILLTTHYMEEADYLGDRIGIMGEGKMQCLGRPLFLKNRFGVGYTFTIAKKDVNNDSREIIQFIQSFISEAKVVTDVSSEITMQLPLETVHKFQKMFESIDKNLEKLRINSYGVSVTTLEQVFLNVTNLLHRKEKKITDKKKLKNNTIIESFDDFDLRKERINSSLFLFATQFIALIKKRIHYFRRDRLGLVLELFLPVVLVIIGVLLTKVNTVPSPIPLPLADNLYEEPFDVRVNSILPDSSFVDARILDEFNQDIFNIFPVPINNVATFDEFIFQNRKKENFSKMNIFFNTLNNVNRQFHYLALVDTRAQEAAPFAFNKINNAILKYATNNPDKEIGLIVSPFKHTVNFATVKNSLDGLGISFIFAIGMSFIPASIITFIVKERESTMKHQQLVSGLSVAAYWFSNYFVDIIKYMIPGVLNCVMAFVLKAEGLTQGEKSDVLWALFMTYGFSVISFVYLTSFLFKDFSVAQTITFFFHFGTGFIGGLAVGMLRMFDLTNSIAWMEQWFFRPFPTFALTYGLLELTNQEIYQKVEKDPYLRSPWELDLSGGDVLYLGATAILYFLLVLGIEFFRNTRIFKRNNFRDKISSKIHYTDDDVEKEAKMIESSSHKDFTVKIDKLCKVYKLNRNQYKIATNQISFGLKNGDCFALLGVNGAGKTTTFKMLSGDILPTSGKAFINQHEVPSQLREAQHDIGYCPQNDPLLDNLTGREHLYLFAALRGIPSSKRTRMVNKILQDVNLTEFANVTAGSYSGGNRRKLSVAIAMVGNPPIIFLDEPSSGMDPEARRFMWEVISKIRTERKKSSIILTTHFMEEAEALSTRMCIMVNGGLRCLGSAQHIKAKYGGGYEIEVKLNLVPQKKIEEAIKQSGHEINAVLNREQVENLLKDKDAGYLASQISKEGSGAPIDMEFKRGSVSINMVMEWILIEKRGEKVEEFLEKYFDEVGLIEHFQSFYRFNIKSKEGISNIFGKLEENKNELNIIQYSVKQSTIEQIFNNFANNPENFARPSKLRNYSIPKIEEDSNDPIGKKIDIAQKQKSSQNSIDWSVPLERVIDLENPIESHTNYPKDP